MAFADSSALKIQRKPINKSLSTNILIKLICSCYHHWNHIKFSIIKFDFIYILAFFHFNLLQSFTDSLYLHDIWITSFFLHLITEALPISLLIIREHSNNLHTCCIAVIREMLKLLSLLKVMLLTKILKTFQKISNILFFKQGKILHVCQWYR